MDQPDQTAEQLAAAPAPELTDEQKAAVAALEVKPEEPAPEAPAAPTEAAQDSAPAGQDQAGEAKPEDSATDEATTEEALPEPGYIGEAPAAPYHLIDSEHYVINLIAAAVGKVKDEALAVVNGVSTAFSHSDVAKYKADVIAWLEAQ